MKKTSASPEVLMKELLRIHVPESYLSFFELASVNNKKDSWELTLVERQDLIPRSLEGKDVVLDGFCNPISILTHTILSKKMYLVIKRRRWKARGCTEHFSNSYELHEKGMKITAEYAAFLKGGN
jgi:hypothetical protein